ncbi:MAG: electron transfer flavoprotein subunit beta [archaeon GB-1845-036]|nr:electron transfer flavoprotein subunit beta [Candidatus Culexmicrobium thermophilum]
MRIAVCVKHAVDVSQLRMDSATGKPLISTAPMKFNDLDRNALEEAVRIKEKIGGSVIAITFGGEKAREILREALAMGADEAIQIVNDINVKPDTYITSQVLSEILKMKGPFDLILLGEMSIDSYSSQIGPRISEILKMPCITYVRSIEVKNGKIKAQRDLEDRYELVEAETPCIITVSREINVPRLPPLMAILKASRKPIEKINLSSLKIDAEPKVLLIDLKGLEVKRKNIVIKDKPVEEMVEELIQHLEKEGVLEG